MVECPI
jgi:hypothetical protein